MDVIKTTSVTKKIVINISSNELKKIIETHIRNSIEDTNSQTDSVDVMIVDHEADYGFDSYTEHCARVVITSLVKEDVQDYSIGV